MSVTWGGSYNTSPRRQGTRTLARRAMAGRVRRSLAAHRPAWLHGRGSVQLSPLARELAELERIQIARPGRPPLSDGSNEPGRALTFDRDAMAAPVGRSLIASRSSHLGSRPAVALRLPGRVAPASSGAGNRTP